MGERREVCVVLRRVPVSSLRNAEALRMSVGLTLAENNVTVVFAGDGVYTLLPIKPERLGSPEVAKHLETLEMMGCRLVADADAIESRGLEELAWGVEQLPRAEIARLLAGAGAVITY
jgi:sulfur relay (sulfurtransferase) DsrF/TusC family protein